MFINLSNHPSDKWSEAQKTEALKSVPLLDLPFPQVSPSATAEEIETLADTMVSKVKDLCLNDPAVIHVMGEMNLTYAMVRKLKALGYRCVASTTERITTENPDGSKTSMFKFVQFREYV